MASQQRLLISALCATAAASDAASFVARCGAQLCLNGQPWRGAGANIYWLGLDENVDGVDYPTQFRVSDALTTAARYMGATLVRGHTLGISVGNPLSFEPSLGVFNASALAMADYALAVGGALGIRFVVPLTDNYHYFHGGKHTFTDWLGAPESEFYTNVTVVNAFKAYVAARLNHVNAFTGMAAKDDPAILAWETGNEIAPPSAWTADIASFIKSIDGNHLVQDGNYGINSGSLPIPDVDIYSDHFYPVDTGRMVSGAAAVHAAGKVYIAGEYGWTSGDVAGFLTAAQGAVDAICYWSLFPHLDTYGWEQHGDGFTIHYPGDDAGMAAAESLIIASTYNVTGVTPPTPLPAPGTPNITQVVTSSSSVAWRGAAGAATYSVGVGASSTGPFNVVCDACATDASTPLVVKPPLASGQWIVVRGVGLGGVVGAWSMSMQAP